MALFSRKTKRVENVVNNYFKALNGYIPSFISFNGSVYEMDLCRASIYAFAQHCSKMKIEVKGNAPENIQLNRILQYKPNPLQTSSQFLARIATILEVENTCFIAPLTNLDGTVITGFFPLLIKNIELIKDEKGNAWVRYQFNNGEYGAVELYRCGILTKFQYENDIFGSNNSALRPTLELINMNNQGIIDGIKAGASIRFMAKIGQTMKAETIEAEKKRFIADNLTSENNGGVLMYDNKFEDVKQITSSPHLVDDKQQNLIKNNVFDYFGTNEDVIQNNYNSEKWNAYYEGKIEPFALQLAQVLTNMLFSFNQIAYGNEVVITTNRMQYLAPMEKLNIVTQLFDRGMMTQNQGLEIFNQAGIGEQGDRFFIRGEYVNNTQLEERNINDGESKE